MFAKNRTEWSKTVKARDMKCMVCGTSNDLHAHHIKHKATNPELILDISNGIALCYRCHKAEHERNRPVRIRSLRPQRGTLERQIAELKAKIISQNDLIFALKKELKSRRLIFTKQIRLETLPG